MRKLFFPGDTRYAKHQCRSRCLWREEQLMLHLVQRTVSPALSLKASVEDWYQLSCGLREAPRRRDLKLEKLER